MIYEWTTDEPLPAGLVISVGEGRLFAAVPGPRLLHSVVLPPTEKERELTDRVRFLEAALDEAHEQLAAAGHDDDCECHICLYDNADLPTGP